MNTIANVVQPNDLPPRHVGEDHLLELCEICRVYGAGATEVRALTDINLTISKGELVAIMGPSGSGKSTLLRVAGALDEPSSGSVLIRGAELNRVSRKVLAELRRRTIGYVFQDLNLLPGLTALENAALPLELDGVSAKAARTAASTALERVGLGEKTHRFPDDLSGGEQQRVAIARAFIGPRDLLLADEPTGALDSATGEQVMQLLREQCDEGRSGLIVTHNKSHAGWADRVVFIRDGRIVSESAA